MTNITLHPLDASGNSFCGPAVIALLSGLVTKDAALLVRHVKGDPTPVRGTTTSQVAKVLRLLGISMVADRRAPATGTLATWVARHGAPHDTFLVAAGHHWILVHGRDHVACSLTGGALVDVANYRMAGARMEAAFRLTQVAKVNAQQLADSVRPTPVQLSAIERKLKKMVTALATAHGIAVDDEWREFERIWVGPPETLPEDADPFEDDHFAYSWEEALEHVEAYVDLLALAGGRLDLGDAAPEAQPTARAGNDAAPAP
ncbi:hypothetical protein [Cupriavidus sp. TMH.W2]|uniref:hypothetical protein n=1 Tax=Cupriavidus sp. TMH.W2 TaxID=3434465 RepID=UPI003D77EC6B